MYVIYTGRPEKPGRLKISVEERVIILAYAFV